MVTKLLPLRDTTAVHQAYHTGQALEMPCAYMQLTSFQD